MSISFQNVDFAYKGKAVYNNLNAQIPNGKIVGLLGENGAGKTTLMKLVWGMLKPNNGSVTYNESVTSEKKAGFLKKVFFLQEQFKLPSMKVEGLALSLQGLYDFSSEQFERRMAKWGIPMDSHTTKLSFGQQKKVALSLGMACQPELLLLDEPSNGLDITAKEQFRQDILEYAGEGKLIMMSTHQVRDLSPVMDWITVVKNGQLALNSSLQEVYSKFAVTNDKSHPAILYAEADTALIRKEAPSEGDIDLEFLYRAIASSNFNPNL